MIKSKQGTSIDIRMVRSVWQPLESVPITV